VHVEPRLERLLPVFFAAPSVIATSIMLFFLGFARMRLQFQDVLTAKSSR
jgi:hypothetical protein